MAIRKVNDKYKAEVYLGLDEITGKKIRKTKTFKKLKEAKDWEIDMLSKFNNGELELSNNMTVSEYLKYYFETYVEVNTKYNTQRRYLVFIDCINDYLGQIKLTDLKTSTVEKFYSEMKKETITLKDKTIKKRYSDGTILKTHKFFNQAIEKSIAWDLLLKNPVKYASPPRDDTREMSTWSMDEYYSFLDKIKDTPIYLPVQIAFHTGLRVGEIAALRWEDININEGYLKVNYNAVEKKGKGVVLESPKTDSSKSTVMLTDELIKELKAADKERKIHKLKSGIELKFVCSRLDGQGLRPTYISKTFRKHMLKYGLPEITFHGLRHTHASILFELGASSQEISKRLRHSRVSTTDDIYIHLKEDTKKSTAELFNKAVDSKVK